MSSQGALDTLWHHLLDLHLMLQVITWALFLPVALGLYIWGSDWTLWLRLALVIMLGIGSLVALSPRNHQIGKSTPTDLGPG